MSKNRNKRVNKIINAKIEEYIEQQGYANYIYIKNLSKSMGGNGAFDTNRFEVVTTDDNKKHIVLNVKNIALGEIVGEIDVALCRKIQVDRHFINKTVTKILKKYKITPDDKFKTRINKTLNSNYGIVKGLAVSKHNINWINKQKEQQRAIDSFENIDSEIEKMRQLKRQQDRQQQIQKEKDRQIQQKKQEEKKQAEEKQKQKAKQYNHVCYRFLTFTGEIIYVGRAENLINRLESHARKGHLSALCYNRVDKVEFCKFESEDELDIAERYYISKFQPEYNVVFKDKKYFTISELDNRQWKEYSVGARILKNR